MTHKSDIFLQHQEGNAATRCRRPHSFRQMSQRFCPRWGAGTRLNSFSTCFSYGLLVQDVLSCLGGLPGTYIHQTLAWPLRLLSFSSAYVPPLSRFPLIVQRAAGTVLDAKCVSPFEVFVRGLEGDSMETVFSCSFSLLFFCSPVTGNVYGILLHKIPRVITVFLCLYRE